MKKINMLLSIVVTVIIASACNNEAGNAPSNSKVSSNENSSINARLPNSSPSSFTWITQNSNGEYVSTYGGGITFSTNFPHLTTVDQSGATDGQSMSGFTNVMFQSPTVTVYSVINGASFDVAEPSSPSTLFPAGSGYLGTFDSEEAAQDALLDYLSDLNDGPVDSGTSYTTVVSGMVVRDHASPTNASIAPATYVYTPGNPTSPTNPTNPTSLILLGTTVISGYTFQFYSATNTTSGSVSKVVVTNPTGVTAIPLSLSYSLSDGLNIVLTGSVKIGPSPNIEIISCNNVTFDSAYW